MSPVWFLFFALWSLIAPPLVAGREPESMAVIAAASKELDLQRADGCVVDYKKFRDGSPIQRLIVKRKGDLFLVRHFGSDLNSALDDRIFVFGAKHDFAVKVVAESGDRFNLVTFSPKGSGEEELANWFSKARSIASRPLSVANEDMELFLSRYETLNLSGREGGGYVLGYSDPFSYEEVFRSGEVFLEFVGSQLAVEKLVVAEAAIIDREGHVQKKFPPNVVKKYSWNPPIYRRFFSAGSSIGNEDEVAEVTEFLDEQIDDAEFTPEFYGIKTEVFEERTPANWAFRAFLVVAILLMVGGSVLRRNPS